MGESNKYRFEYRYGKIPLELQIDKKPRNGTPRTSSPTRSIQRIAENSSKYRFEYRYGKIPKICVFRYL